MFPGVQSLKCRLGQVVLSCRGFSLPEDEAVWFTVVSFLLPSDMVRNVIFSFYFSFKFIVLVRFNSQGKLLS